MSADKDRLGRTGQSVFLPQRRAAAPPPAEPQAPAPQAPRPRGRPRGPDKVPVTVQFELDPLDYLDDARKAYRRLTRANLDRSALIMRLVDRMADELTAEQLASWLADHPEPDTPT